MRTLLWGLTCISHAYLQDSVSSTCTMCGTLAGDPSYPGIVFNKQTISHVLHACEMRTINPLQSRYNAYQHNQDPTFECVRCLLSTCRHRADPHHCPLALPHCAVAPTAEQIAAVLVLASTEVEALQRRDHLALLSFLVDEVRKGAGSLFMFICRGSCVIQWVDVKLVGCIMDGLYRQSFK